ncbi:MAG TPA: FkbM family methyltransferase [Opitutaceae bacterium]|nr:FkbM family methyltransferase [Opitutaceae bacterium]
MGRFAPSALRFMAHHYPSSRGRYAMLRALTDDARCREWLARLENPTKTRRGFRIFTRPGDLTSDWIKLYGQHEAGTERFILEHLRPGSTFLDIGANIGYFSLLAAVTGGAKVVAFEPQRPIADLLLRSVAHNRVEDSARVERLALSNAPGTGRMTSCPDNTGHAQLAGIDEKGAQPYPVEVAVLDEWLKGNPVGPVSVCKIDTEGADLRVLQGMAQLLAREGPAIVIEIIEDFLAEFGGSGPKVLELLRSHGYCDISGRYACRGDCNRYLVRTPDS